MHICEDVFIEDGVKVMGNGYKLASRLFNNIDAGTLCLTQSVMSHNTRIIRDNYLTFIMNNEDIVYIYNKK